MGFSNHYYLGILVKTHALKGNLVVYLDTDEPNYYRKLKRIFIDKEGNLSPFFVENAKILPNGNLMIKLKDVDLDMAQTLVKKEVYLPLDELPPLSGKKFYYHEVIDFMVIDENQNQIGKINHINDKTPQHLFEIKNNHNKEILIPIVDEWLLEVNRQERLIKIQLPEGLVDLYTKSE